MTRKAIEQNGPVTMLPLDEVPDDALDLRLRAIWGHRLVAIEKIMGADQPPAAVLALEAHLGQQADLLMAFEAGGSNSHDAHLQRSYPWKTHG